MRQTESWQQSASSLGFHDEAEMLKHLYILQGFSFEQMHQILGYCTWSIRRRLIELGVPLRGRGGPNNRAGKRRLKHVSDEDLEQISAKQLAAKHQVHISTVYAESRFRAKEKENAVRSHNADKVLSRLGSAIQVSHGTGPVLQDQTLPGVLPEEG